MKKVIVLVLFASILSLSLSAQSKKEKIIQLFEVMKSDQLINSMMENIPKMYAQQSANLDNPQQDSIYKTYMNYVVEETKAFSKKLLHEDMVELYDKYFTLQEIQAYIDFYNTPAGKKMLNILPELQADLFTNISKKHMPELQEKFRRKLEELNK